MRQDSSFDKASFLLSQLRIGWGTARVGCGMGVGAYLYSLCSLYFDPSSPKLNVNGLNN